MYNVFKNMAVKLNLGCGREKLEGYVNVDIIGNPDVKHDLDVYPFPFKKNSVDFILASHILEHLKEPMDFLKECYRILKKQGRMKIKVPHCEATGGAFGDLTHRHYYHESAIGSVTGQGHTEFINHPFKLIKTIVKRGRFLKWQKREIIWVIEKNK